MPHVDFYILPDGTPKGRDHLACRIAEKAYALGNKVYVHTDSPAQTLLLDDLLWTFKSGSFLPHAPYGKGNDDLTPILIGHGGDPQFDAEVLINLSSDVPRFFEHFERIVEVVDPLTESKRAARKRFRFYRDQGCSLESHQLSG